MTVVGPWPLYPIGKRIKEGLSDNVPVTFLFGKNTWIPNVYGTIIKEHRQDSYTNVIVVENAGHHIYLDNAPEFNKSVLDACKILSSHFREN